MTKTKSFNKNTKHKALYHALMESILKDEDAMDKGVADKSKKRKPDDANKDEGPPVRPDQGLKRKKTGKETEPSKKAKSTGTSKGTTKSQPKSIGKSAQAEEIVFEAGDTQVPQNQGDDMGNTDEPPVVNKWLSVLAKAEKSSKTFDDLISTSIDFSAFVLNRLHISDLTQDILVRPAYELLNGACRSYVELDYNMEECYKVLNDQLDWNNPEDDRYPFDLSKPLPLIQSRNHHVVPVDYFFNNDLSYLQGESTGRIYTTSLTKTKAVKYDLPRIEDMTSDSTKRILEVTNVKVNVWYGYGHLKEIEVRKSDQPYQKKLNISKPRTRKEYLSQRASYTTLSDPQGVIYKDKLNKKRLMHSDELYKFNDGILQSVRDTLYDVVTNLRMRFNTTAENPVKEILLKLNLPDHRVDPHEFKDSYKDGHGVLELKNFKKDDYKSFQDQEKYEHVGQKVTSTQDGKISQDHMQVKLKGTSSSLKSKDHYAYHKLKDKIQDHEQRSKTFVER
ncbi:hypothetical protein Tco_1217072 [Tanacetum coccineum]